MIAIAAKTQLNTFESLSHAEKYVARLLSLYVYDNEEIGKRSFGLHWYVGHCRPLPCRRLEKAPENKQ